VEGVKEFDLAKTPLREVTRWLHREVTGAGVKRVKILNADGAHSIAAGMAVPLDIEIDGHAGYYAGGMNQHANITVHGNAGPGVGENMMSGTIRVKGFASTAAGASAHGGTLVITGDAALRCGISLKGGDIVVGGDVGSFSAFMAQAGRIVICGDAGDALGDSIYEAKLFVRGKVKSLGADCVKKKMHPKHIKRLKDLLERAGVKGVKPEEFTRYGSARTLYNFNIDNADAY
jgi:glutamate synthase domain-containing protein 3